VTVQGATGRHLSAASGLRAWRGPTPPSAAAFALPSRAPAESLPALSGDARGTPVTHDAPRKHVNTPAARPESRRVDPRNTAGFDQRRRVDLETLPDSTNVDALTPKRCRQGSIGDELCVEA
jgi:hypothetical protein